MTPVLSVCVAKRGCSDAEVRLAFHNIKRVLDVSLVIRPYIYWLVIINNRTGIYGVARGKSTLR